MSKVADVAARMAAQYQYAKAHDRFAELEQLARSRNKPAEANGAHIFALIALRAYRAECDDPQPKELVT